MENKVKLLEAFLVMNAASCNKISFADWEWY